MMNAISKAVSGINPRLSAQIASTSAGALVRDLNATQQRYLKRVLKQALEQDLSEQEVTDLIAQRIGLDERFSNAVEGFRQGLVNKGVPKGQARTQSRVYAKRLRSSRARTIARTELAKAVGDAKRELWKSWKQDGVIDQYAVRVYHTHRDEMTCPVCRPMNGKRAAVDRPYAAGHDGPPLHPNCRCWESLQRGATELMKESTHG